MNRDFADMSGSNNEMIIIQSPLANLVPEDEQAVEDEIVCPDSEIKLDVVNPYTSIFSEEDIAVEPMEDLSELAEANKKGFFSPVVGMARLVNAFGGRYYARICVDETGSRRIEICQQYETGAYSPKISIKQSDFLRAASYNFGESAISQKKLKNAVENFIFKLSSECLDKFDGTMSFDVVKVLNAIKKCYQDLPVYKNFCEKESPAEFYRSLQDVLKRTFLLNDEGILYGHKAYYPFDGDTIQFIAEQMDMKKNELLKRLKEYNFLYLTESSVGYQTNVRLTVDDGDGEPETYTEWRYCVLRINYLASN